MTTIIRLVSAPGVVQPDVDVDGVLVEARVSIARPYRGANFTRLEPAVRDVLNAHTWTNPQPEVLPLDEAQGSMWETARDRVLWLERVGSQDATGHGGGREGVGSRYQTMLEVVRLAAFVKRGGADAAFAFVNEATHVLLDFDGDV